MLEHPELLVELGKYFESLQALWMPDACRIQELRGSVAATLTSSLMPMATLAAMALLVGYVVASEASRRLRSEAEHRQRGARPKQK